jgi:predicted ABC-type ATPase
MPRLVMMAGPNGSGKSTLTDALMAAPGVDLPAIYINADELQRKQKIADAAVAQRKATEARARARAKARDFMYETVMSHPSKLAELQQARAEGYHVTIHFVSTRHADINVHRVALRVAAGGHPVPEARLRQRHLRTMALAPLAIGLADEALVFDNSLRGSEGGLRLQAQLMNGALLLCTSQPEAWVAELAVNVRERTAELPWLHDEAQARQLPLVVARLDGGRTVGPIEIAGRHHVLQHDLQGRVLVLHDRTLLPADAALAIGRHCCIDYLEGVGSVEPVAAEPVRRRGA